MTVLIFIFLCLLELFPLTSADSLNPRRPPNEEEYWKIGHHERATTVSAMQQKIQAIKDRRKQKPWDLTNQKVREALKKNTTRPNLLLILADDLGYGDLSVPPFTHPPESSFPCGEGGIVSPHLERMASNGVTMVNFHSASPVCSPSRVAIMTSLYPWRLGAMNAFELGRDMSQRNGFLPQVPTGAEMLREAGYYTAHSGKWHLGGMREEMRLDRVNKDQCSRGSPNQHGFEEYVSGLDGPESPRYTFLLRNSILHSKGHRHLLRDDVPVPISAMENLPAGSQYTLSDREAEDAIEVMKTNKKDRPGQPWFIQVSVYVFILVIVARVICHTAYFICRYGSMHHMDLGKRFILAKVCIEHHIIHSPFPLSLLTNVCNHMLPFAIQKYGNIKPW